MNPKLEKAINTFCFMMPDAKIGIYEHQPLDDERIAKIACLSFFTGDDVTAQDFIDGLTKYNPTLHAKDIQDCAKGVHDYYLQIKKVLPDIYRTGYLVKKD